MLLSTIFDALTYGELKQVNIGGAEDGEGIHPKYTTEILSHLNLGMLDLYEKFPLQEKELKLITQEGKTWYTLTPENALSQDPDGYIDDTDETFLGDILSICRAFDVDNNQLRLNNEDAATPILTPVYNQVWLPEALGEEEYTFVYKVRPAEVAIPNGLLPTNVDVALPPILMAPLLVYISARVHSSKGGDTKQEGAYLMVQYEQMCKVLELKGTFNNSLINANERAQLAGWV
jgi:hypothetical protein